MDYLYRNNLIMADEVIKNPLDRAERASAKLTAASAALGGVAGTEGLSSETLEILEKFGFSSEKWVKTMEGLKEEGTSRSGNENWKAWAECFPIPSKNPMSKTNYQCLIGMIKETMEVQTTLSKASREHYQTTIEILKELMKLNESSSMMTEQLDRMKELISH
jgi:hypothetical protein